MQVLTSPTSRLAKVARIPEGQPLTDKQKRMIESVWPMAMKVLGNHIEKGRISVKDVAIAESVAGKIATRAARAWRPGEAEFTTYLWIALDRHLPAQVNLVKKRNDRVISGMNKLPTLRRGEAAISRSASPEAEATRNEIRERIQLLLEQLGEHAPGQEEAVRRWMGGETMSEIGQSRGITGRAVQQQIDRARKWMAKKLRREDW